MPAKVHFVQAPCTVHLDSCAKPGKVEWWHLMWNPKWLFILIFKNPNQWYFSPSINTPFKTHKIFLKKLCKNFSLQSCV